MLKNTTKNDMQSIIVSDIQNELVKLKQNNKDKIKEHEAYILKHKNIKPFVAAFGALLLAVLGFSVIHFNWDGDLGIVLFFPSCCALLFYLFHEASYDDSYNFSQIDRMRVKLFENSHNVKIQEGFFRYAGYWNLMTLEFDSYFKECYVKNIRNSDGTESFEIKDYVKITS